LLRNSSPSRVRQACQEQLSSADTIVSLCALHRRYGPLYDEAKQQYKARTGKAAGWQPDLAFLRQLAPVQEPFATLDQLRAIARAVRLLLTSTSINRTQQEVDERSEPLAPSSVTENSDSDAPSPGELRGLIDAALQRAMDQHLPAVLAGSGKDRELLRCLWAGWTEGLKQRPLAERCNTSQGSVSKKLQPETHATAIATAAAVELRRHPAFASCGSSVEAAERLVSALRNHLLEPEQEGNVAPLRQAVARILATLAP